MAKNKKGKSKTAASSSSAKSAGFNPPSEPTFLARDIVTCAENIALLEFLHSTPELPSRNAKPPPTTRDAEYSLPFEKERALCASFAFIASVRSDPNRIPAVCLEEDCRGQVLKILVAVNADSAGDSSKTLEEIKSGFESILAILGRVSNDTKSPSGTENEVLQATVNMCSDRIQERLRIKHKRYGTKRSLFKDTLKRALEDLKHPSIPSDLERSKAAFATRAKETLSLLTPLEGHPDIATLQAIVESMYRLSQAPDLEIVISHTLCDRPARISLLNIIQRVARYKEAARQFYRAAKKFTMVRNSQVVLVRLEPEAFQRVMPSSNSPNIESTLASRSIRKNHRNLDQVCLHLAGTSSPNERATADEKFVEQCHETMRNGKIHAEIQLLYHCQAKPSNKPPRVVCSSKDACYMCNTFITMHKVFHTPGCHGKLYPGWRLPSTHLGQTKKFNQVLETHLRESLKTLFQRKEKTSYPQPNESSLWTMILSNTTLMSSSLTAPEVLDSRDDSPSALEGLSIALVTSDSTVPISVAGDIVHGARPVKGNERPACNIHSEDPMEGVEKTDWAGDTSMPELGPTRSRPTASDSTSHESNKSSTALSGHLVSGETSGLYTEGLFGIQVENVASPSSPSNGAPSLDFTIRWLTAEEAELARKNRSVTIVEANCLEGEVSYASTSQDRTVYISHAGQVAEIRLS